MTDTQAEAPVPVSNILTEYDMEEHLLIEDIVDIANGLIEDQPEHHLTSVDVRAILKIFRVERSAQYRVVGRKGKPSNLYPNAEVMALLLHWLAFFQPASGE